MGVQTPIVGESSYLDPEFVEAVGSGVPFNEKAPEPVVLSGSARALVLAIGQAREEAANPHSDYAREARIDTLSKLFSGFIVPAQRQWGLPAHAILKDGEGISFEAHREAIKKEIEALRFSNIHSRTLGFAVDRTLNQTFQIKAVNFVERHFPDIALDDVKTEPAPDVAA